MTVALPDGLDRVGWAWLDEHVDANDNFVGATAVGGLLGSTVSLRVETGGQVSVGRDVFAVVRGEAGRSTIEIYRISTGPNFEATGLVEAAAGPQVVVRQRLANGGRSLSLVDVASGARRVLIPTLPSTVNTIGDTVSYTPMRATLPDGWILLVPDRDDLPAEGAPPALLVNVDGRTIEIPSWPTN